MLIPENRPPTTPGEFVREFTDSLGITQADLARRLGMDRGRLNEVINGKRRVSPETALRLAKFFGTSPQFWLNGQLAVDLYRAQHDEREMSAVDRITPVSVPCLVLGEAE